MFSGSVETGIDDIANDCKITPQVKENIITHQNDSSLVGFSSLVGDDSVKFVHD